jgi:hypothetical protein
MVRVLVGFAVLGLVMHVVHEGLMRYARRHGYDPYYQLGKNATVVAGLTGLGVGLPIMGQIEGLVVLLPALAAAGLFRWWYGRPTAGVRPDPGGERDQRGAG